MTKAYCVACGVTKNVPATTMTGKPMYRSHKAAFRVPCAYTQPPPRPSQASIGGTNRPIDTIVPGLSADVAPFARSPPNADNPEREVVSVDGAMLSLKLAPGFRTLRCCVSCVVGSGPTHPSIVAPETWKSAVLMGKSHGCSALPR